MDLLRTLEKLVSIPSVTADGNEECANYVADLLTAAGARSNLQLVPHSSDEISKRQFNVMGVIGDPLVDRKIRKGLLLVAHLDTAPPGLAASWETNGGNPRKLTVKDGVAHGLGVVDAKFTLACMIEAMSYFREAKLKQPICFLGTCGEKAGMLGAKYLLQSLTLNPRSVIVGAATGLRVGVAHHSRTVVRVSAGFQTLERDARGFNRRVRLQSFGRGGSSSFSSDGVHSFLQLLDFLRTTVESGFEIQVTKIGGGVLPDQTPDFSEAELFLTPHQFEDFKRFFREALSVNPKGNTFRLEMGGGGDLGIRFLPQGLFSLFYEMTTLQDSIVSELASLQAEGFEEPDAGFRLNRVVQSRNKMDLWFDLRLPPGADLKMHEKKIRDAIQGVASGYSELVVQTSVEFSHPAYSERTEGAEWETESVLASGAKPYRSSWCNEAGLFRAKGFPAIFYGAGTLPGNAYSPSESVNLSDGQKAISFFEERIRKACT